MKNIYLCLFILLLSLVSINSYSSCPTEWSDGETKYFYEGCFLQVNYQYRLTANCELQIKGYTITPLSEDMYCYNLLTNNLSDEFLRTLYQNALSATISIIDIPPCSSGQVTYYISKLSSCCQLLSDGHQMTITDCSDENSTRCFKTYTICKKNNGDGTYSNVITLVDSFVINGTNCSTIDWDSLIWYDSNGNIIDDPFSGFVNSPTPNLLSPIHTNCYNINGCGN